jgi:hypothetical protein
MYISFSKNVVPLPIPVLGTVLYPYLGNTGYNMEIYYIVFVELDPNILFLLFIVICFLNLTKFMFTFILQILIVRFWSLSFTIVQFFSLNFNCSILTPSLPHFIFASSLLTFLTKKCLYDILKFLKNKINKKVFKI